MEGGSRVQRQGRPVRGEWCNETRMVQWEKGEAVGYVVILFHPPN